jgi:hypothetical protein
MTQSRVANSPRSNVSLRSLTIRRNAIAHLVKPADSNQTKVQGCKPVELFIEEMPARFHADGLIGLARF